MHAPKNHTLTQTEDGSFSLYSENFQEGCHSFSGARKETELHYLQGCKIQEGLSVKTELIVLEVGFGSGLGFEMTRELLKEGHGRLRFISLEIDPELTRWSFERLGLEASIEKLHSGMIWTAKAEGYSLTVLVGNARTLLPLYLKQFSPRFDAIYQDAFSPKRNPVLWTKEWFSLLKEYSNSDAILSTYSASNSIRKSLVEAGWILQKGESFGPKRASTRAGLQGSSDLDIIEQMSRSPSTAIYDSQLPKELFL